MRAVFAATQSISIAKTHIFRKLNIENLRKLFELPGYKFPLKLFGKSGSQDGNLIQNKI